MDAEIKKKDWDNTVDAILEYKTREYLEERGVAFLRDDGAWAGFIGIDELVLKRELRRREKALQ